MEKTYVVQGSSNTEYKSFDEAVIAGQKKMARSKDEDLKIFEAVAVIKSPIPTYEVVKF